MSVTITFGGNLGTVYMQSGSNASVKMITNGGGAPAKIIFTDPRPITLTAQSGDTGFKLNDVTVTHSYIQMTPTDTSQPFNGVIKFWITTTAGKDPKIQIENIDGVGLINVAWTATDGRRNQTLNNADYQLVLDNYDQKSPS